MQLVITAGVWKALVVLPPSPFVLTHLLILRNPRYGLGALKGVVPRRSCHITTPTLQRSVSYPADLLFTHSGLMNSGVPTNWEERGGGGGGGG